MSTDLVRILDEQPAELPPTKLPTIGDVLKTIYFEIRVQNQAKAAIKTVANQIKDMWQKCAIPTVSVQRIIVKLTDIYDTHKKLAKAASSAASEDAKISFKVKIFCLFLFYVFKEIIRSNILFETAHILDS